MRIGMTQRIDYSKVSPAAVKAMMGMEGFVRQSGLEHELVHLVKLRASYINGCAYCVDMHTKDARAAGESEQRLYAVPLWRETPFFTPRERAALAFTESVTAMGPHGVPEELFAETRSHFSEEETVALVMAIVTINAWNRLSVTFQADVGSYQPRALATAS
jgi:AhpD family alkylhydroperoxidase